MNGFNQVCDVRHPTLCDARGGSTSHVCDKLDKINRDFLWAPHVRKEGCTWWGGVKLLSPRKKGA